MCTGNQLCLLLPIPLSSVYNRHSMLFQCLPSTFASEFESNAKQEYITHSLVIEIGERHALSAQGPMIILSGPPDNICRKAGLQASISDFSPSPTSTKFLQCRPQLEQPSSARPLFAGVRENPLQSKRLKSHRRKPTKSESIYCTLVL